MMLAGMQPKFVAISVLLLVSGLTGPVVRGQTLRPYDGIRGGGGSTRDGWLNRDMHVDAGTLQNYAVAPGQQLLLCREGVSVALANREFTCDRAFVWITMDGKGSAGDADAARYHVQVYLGGNIADAQFGDRQEADLMETVVEPGEAVVLKADVTGEVFITSDARETVNPIGLPLYAEAIAAFEKAGAELPPSPEPLLAAKPAGRPGDAVGEPNEPPAGATVGYALLTETVPEMERTVSQDEEIITIIGRVYVWWQEPNESTGQISLFELQADNLVVWRGIAKDSQQGGSPTAMQEEGVTEIYVAGDVLLRQGQQTIRAEELYYDLRNRRALASNVVLRSFDETRNIPIYVRAGRLRQVASNEYDAEEVVLSASEFWSPQFSLEASRIHVTTPPQEEGTDVAASDSDFSVLLEDVKFKYGKTTLLGLPSLRANRQRPDVPIRSIRVGHDKTYGTSLETRWFLSRIFGLAEPEGTDSTLALDYYGDRGLGGGAEITYERENYFGSILGYAIDDHGEDRLSRTRKNLEVPEGGRGRFRLRHRHFLPYSWQLTAEGSYLSDENFLEQFYRSEFNVGKEQETLLHLKRIDDNWGLSFLGKTRVNDFLDKVEELPTAEYHLMGQSLFNDLFTFYSDNQVSRYRYRYSPENPQSEPDDFFTFTGTRNELDLPLAVGGAKVVPFIAGTFGYEDGGGFQTQLDDVPAESEDAIWLGEAGVRMSAQPFWSVYPNVESRLLDLHQLRHIIRPSITAVTYAESDAVAEQRDTLDLGIAQRWQTKRGPAGRRRTVDWLALNLDFVWVGDSSDYDAGADRFLWNRPFVPLVNRLGGVIPPLDRRTMDVFTPRQNYVSADTTLRLTDTTSILSDIYFDMQHGIVEQFDIGFSRLCWPNLSYYLGTRYLRVVRTPEGERGANSLNFAATYVLDPRYTVVLAEEYDFDYDSNIRTDITLIRKYHRMNLALTFSADESLDEQRAVLSLWPEGIPELAIGLRKYMGLGESDVYY